MGTGGPQGGNGTDLRPSIWRRRCHATDTLRCPSHPGPSRTRGRCGGSRTDCAGFRFEQVRIRLPDRNLGVAAINLPVRLRHAIRISSAPDANSVTTRNQSPRLITGDLQVSTSSGYRRRRVRAVTRWPRAKPPCLRSGGWVLFPRSSQAPAHPSHSARMSSRAVAACSSSRSTQQFAMCGFSTMIPSSLVTSRSPPALRAGPVRCRRRYPRVCRRVHAPMLWTGCHQVLALCACLNYLLVRNALASVVRTLRASSAHRACTPKNLKSVW